MRVLLFVMLLTALLTGCRQSAPVPLDPEGIAPAQFAGARQSDAPVENWLGHLGADYLAPVVASVIADNHALAQQQAVVDIARERVAIIGADRWPALSIGADGRRGRPTADADVSEGFTANGTVRFEVDLWGKLSARQRAARLDLAAEELRYQRAERALVAQTASAIFDLISAERLARLFEQRLKNLTQALDVIERGYRSGLNDALDVYLAQTTTEQERANIASQQQAVFERSVAVELLTASYPGGARVAGWSLPELQPISGHGVPADLLKRRSDIQQSWLSVLAADAELAAAHRDRFPSLNLAASVSDSADVFSQLLSGDSLAWSVTAGLLQPVFSGGRLQALEAQARIRAEQAERRYLEVLNRAFAEVEIELERVATLEARLAAFRSAGRNADAALELASSQYERGLVTYTTVLEAQRRSFDAQTTIVQLENQVVQNRVALHLALGGAY